ncbi:MAG TPA: ABC transporter permease [Candidatus Blautia merdigallinarum]|uniref:ABC transporter permease n=1 Tax=Candidatus Blautia merdigallinarum TaxID=2838495 RepID=A0A9D2SIS4_9FIRM|nr:ABC transporter permease [Candidatus Blautia merdigallinarum]
MTSRNYLLKSITGNLRRNLWLIILFFLGFFAVGPVRLLVSLDAARHTAAPYPSGFTMEEYLRWTFRSNISLNDSMTIALVVVCAALAAFAGFLYLYSQEKTDFYHSLPLKREKLFAVQFISGFLIFLIPCLLNLLISFGIGGVYGAIDLSALEAAGIQILFAVVYFLAVYGAGVLAVLLTGNLFAGILGFIALVAYGPVLYLTYTRLNYHFFDTLVPEMESGIGEFFSPVTAYIQAGSLYGRGETVTQYLLYGILLAAVLILADVLVYRLRPSESFHRTIAFKKLEPVIKVCGLPPLVLLVALFFGSQMYEGFFWMAAAALVLTLIFSAVYDFLCTMDIRTALKPRISTGVILAGLVLILGGYQMDITGVDRYLPGEEKIASMSVYFNSINGQLGYPEGTGAASLSVFLKENRVEDFHDIYRLAQKGVEYYEENGAYDQQDTSAEAGGAQQTQVSIYIGYHLKSGQDVYRLYYLPETEELVENVEEIYDNWEYRETVLPTSYIDPADIEGIDTYSFSEAGKPLNLSKNSADIFMKTYKGELENLTFAQSREEKVVGYMELQENAEGDQGYYLYDDYIYTYYLPVYESFEKTRELLEDMGNPMPAEISAEEVEAIDLSRYVNEDGVDIYQEKSFQDKDDIETILKQLTYAESRFTVGSPVNYDVSVVIRWKDQEKEQTSLSLFENDSLSDILNQLYQQNID